MTCGLENGLLFEERHRVMLVASKACLCRCIDDTRSLIEMQMQYDTATGEHKDIPDTGKHRRDGLLCRFRFEMPQNCRYPGSIYTGFAIDGKPLWMGSVRFVQEASGYDFATIHVRTSTVESCSLEALPHVLQHPVRTFDMLMPACTLSDFCM
jgi:hypothetical protein